MIPEGWKENRISDIANINPKRSLSKGTIAKFVEMAAVSEQFSSISYFENKEFSGSGTKFTNNDVLFARITPCAENGKTALVDFLNCDEVAAGSTEFIVLAPVKGKANPKFLFYLMKWSRLRNFAISNMEGTSGRQRVPARIFSEIFLKIPPIPEQIRIAEILTSVDAAIAATEKVIAQTKRVKQALLQELLTRGIGHTKFKITEIGEIPESWEVAKLRTVCTKIQDGNYGADYPKKNEFLNSGVMFFTSKAVGSGSKLIFEKADFISIDKHMKLKKAHIEVGDILFTNRGANVGAVAVTPIFAHNANIGPQLTLIRTDSSIISNLYLFYFMQSDLFRKQILGRDAGSAMKFFSISSTENFKIAVPDLINQEKITGIIQGISLAIEASEEKNFTLHKVKSSLLQVLLTGAVRVSNHSLH